MVETDFNHVLRARRSIRRFLPTPVPEDILERLLEMATWAPSAHNRQPWRFAVLTDPVVKSLLADEMAMEFQHDLSADGLPLEEIRTRLERSRNRINQAPVVVVLCLDLLTMDRYSDAQRQHAEYLMGVQSVAMAGGSLLLAAQVEGLGGVWMCAPLFAPDAILRALNLPKEWQPQGLLLLGYPALVPETPPRRRIDEITRFYTT